EARGFSSIEVKPLTKEQQQELIAETLTRWRRKLEAQHIARILKPDAPELASSPLYLKTVLEELRVSADNARLAQRLDDYGRARDMPDLFDRVLARLEEDCEVGLLPLTLPLIWGGRAGLEESEIVRIAGATPMAWATLRNGLGDGLRDQAGRIAFSHDFLRRAVEARYLPSNEARRATHLRIANHFAGLARDGRQAEELPYQLREGEAWAQLEALLLDFDHFDLLHARGNDELLRHWLALARLGRNFEGLLCSAFERRTGSADRWIETDVTLAFLLADFLRYAGGLGQAAQHLGEQRTAACERLLGPRDPRTAASFNNLAGLYRAANKIDEAEELYRKALQLAENVSGPTHPTVAKTLDNLARVLADTNRHAEAEPLNRRALAIFEQTLGPTDPNFAAALANLGSLMFAMNRLEEAEPLFRRSLETHTEIFGPDHPAVAASLSGIVVLLTTVGLFAVAEPLARRALQINEQALGPDHLDVARDLNNLAEVLSSSGRPAEAESLFQRALKIDEKIFGLSHPRVATGLINLAGALHEMGRFAEAETALRRALSIMEADSRNDHPYIQIILRGLEQVRRSADAQAKR
ncbi:MAG: tetratricopeptide repeat protein, partial [Hyphomonadaceae bacterium]